jgi:hypothetical protein
MALVCREGFAHLPHDLTCFLVDYPLVILVRDAIDLAFNPIHSPVLFIDRVTRLTLVLPVPAAAALRD